jgi:hypothetical protein
LIVVELGCNSTNKKIPAFLFDEQEGVMNIQKPTPSAYASVKTDPMRLASATIQAVDRIGEATSEGIEETADEIMQGATEIAEKLRALATAIREHSRIANEHVTGFCNKATSVLDGIRNLQQKLNGGEAEEKTAGEDDACPLPSLIKAGPAYLDDL